MGKPTSRLAHFAALVPITVIAYLPASVLVWLLVKIAAAYGGETWDAAAKLAASTLEDLARVDLCWWAVLLAVAWFIDRVLDP